MLWTFFLAYSYVRAQVIIADNFADNAVLKDNRLLNLQRL